MDMTNQLMFDMARTQSTSRLPSVSPNAMPEKIREAAQEFEAVFATQMLEPMFEGLSTDGMFGGGNAENIYRSFLVKEIAQKIAEGGGFGIADSVAREMLALQEAQSQG